MKNVDKVCFQGDVMFRRVAALPEGVTEVKDLVVAHSETGHHHLAVGQVKKYTSEDPMIGYLVAQGNTEIQHLRPFDTHETINLLGGDEGDTVWQFKRQREHTPEGWRRVED